MTPREKTLTKIYQLLALAKSTTFPHERESARSKVRSLTEKHKVTWPEFDAFQRGQGHPQQQRPVRRQGPVRVRVNAVEFSFANGMHVYVRSYWKSFFYYYI